MMENLYITIFITILIIGICITLAGYMFYKQNKQLRNIQAELVSAKDYLSIKTETEGIENYNIEKFKHYINNSSNATLNKYIVEFYNTNNFDMSKMHENIIKGLDDKTLEYGIIRMSVLEANSDISKTFAGMVALCVFFVTAYNSFSEAILGKSVIFHAGLSLCLSCFVFFSIVKAVADQKINHSPVAFFKGLFEYELRSRKES